jgi:hypothetical protein
MASYRLSLDLEREHPPSIGIAAGPREWRTPDRCSVTITITRQTKRSPGLPSGPGRDRSHALSVGSEPDSEVLPSSAYKALKRNMV